MAASATGWAELPPPPPAVPVPPDVLLELPPQALSPSARAGAAATAMMRVFFMCVCAPCFRYSETARPRRLPRPWVEGVTQAVPEEVEGEDRHEDGHAGRHHEPRVHLVPLRRVREHAAPCGARR